MACRSVPACPGRRSWLRGLQDGTSPVGRGRTGSKHLLITEATGIPLAVTLTGGNRKNVTQLIPLLKAVPAVRGKRRRPRRRPDVVLGDRSYDHDTYRRLVRALGVKPVIAPPPRGRCTSAGDTTRRNSTHNRSGNSRSNGSAIHGRTTDHTDHAIRGVALNQRHGCDPEPSYLSCCRRTISVIQMGANGDVQPGEVG